MTIQNPPKLHYTKDHEWIKNNDDGTFTIGVTDYGQELLNEMVYVELPEVGQMTTQGEKIATLESAKSVTEVNAPINGEVVAINEELLDAPTIINEDAFEKGWILKIKSDQADKLESLLDVKAYNELIGR